MDSINTRTQLNVTTSHSVCAVIIIVPFHSTTIIPVLHVPIRSLLGIEAFNSAFACDFVTYNKADL